MIQAPSYEKRIGQGSDGRHTGYKYYEVIKGNTKEKSMGSDSIDYCLP